tara:strand:+ start:2169 stop:2906 length:738 start_codon:yes stop_codon:yes gene_type:complete
MAKRYIDTEMWKKKWFRKLSPKMKNAWYYLITMCNHAGLYEVDIDLMSVFIGEKITEDEIFRSGLSTQIEILDDDKWYLPKFIKFQYNVSSPMELNANNRVHKSVIDILNSYSLLDEARKPHTRPLNSEIRGLQGASTEKEGAIYKDKDKNKDKDSNKGSNKIKRKVFKKPTEQEVKDYCDERKNNVDPARFLAHYESKGWMIGKNKMVDWKAAVRTWEKNNYGQDNKQSRVFVEPEHRVKNRGW